jgi:DNA-binding NarL/FixJ family response regulator
MKIVIIDDHLVVRKALRRLLSSALNISVHEATSTQEALADFERIAPIWCS